MPFGLKSVGATYPWGIQWCLYSQLGFNAEAYVDDVVVKTSEEEGLIADLAETFDNLRKFKMKLNLKKCTLVYPHEKYSGIWSPVVVKVSVITKMKLPESLHDVEKLTGSMAALSRFVSRLDIRGLPFFEFLLKQDKFQ
jgi:hypothetical protein